METIKNTGLATVIAATLSSPAAAEVINTKIYDVKVSVAATGLEHPWGVEILPDGALLVTERPGRLRIVSDGRLSAPLSGLPQISPTGQGGLLDVALSRDFSSSGLVFLTFSEPGDSGVGTSLARAKLVRQGDRSKLEDLEVLFSMKPKSRGGRHFGSRIVINPTDDTILFTIGDRGDQDRAQDMNDHAGSVIRIKSDGSIPSNNPWADGTEGKPELWSKGHRNPQGATWDPVTQSLWITEHGARGGDEVNQPEAGKNYGWPVISYGRHYSGIRIGIGTKAPGYEQPKWYWDPSIAPSGLDVYDGEMFPEWKGDLLAGALKFQLVARLTRDNTGKITGEERMFEGKFGRIRDIQVASDGSIYLLTDASNGQIIHLTRAD